MSEFQDPFQVTADPPLCDPTPCPDCNPTPSIDDCFICGYPSGAFDSCSSTPTPCLSGSVECLDCETVFENLDIKFLGGFVSGFSSKIGFGPSESSLNVDIVLPKYKCPPATIQGPVGVCCLPDQSCSAGYEGEEDCENAGGVWYGDQTCDDNPCSCPECNENSKYEGKLGYIYTFNMGAFCFKGILSNHTYTEDNSGYKYRVTLTDGRTILSNTAVLLNGTYAKLPKQFKNNAISVGASEDSVAENTCGDGGQCKDFMMTGSNSTRGVKLKAALEAINNHCISIPISNAGLKINVTKLINIISDDLRTTTAESTVLELITLATEESGYDFIININNNNEFEVLPVNQKRPATEKSLFNFIEDLTAKDIVISKDYGEEMAGSSSKSKRIVFGDNLSYLTTVRDYQYQLKCELESTEFIESGVCCAFGSVEDEATNAEQCEDVLGIWYPHYVYDESLIDYDALCSLQPMCTIKNNPASIGAYETFYITPTPITNPEC
jgi:hypothetical protein